MDNNVRRLRAANPRVEKRFNDKLVKHGRVSKATLDNGGRPYMVIVIDKDDDETNKLDVVVVCIDGDEGREGRVLGKTMTFRDVDCVWFGCGEYGDVNEKRVGNTVLITKEEGTRQVCTSVAGSVIQFTLKDNERVSKYVSTVGNSAVPYGWIETDRGVYALDSFNCLPKGWHGAFLPWSVVEKLEIGLDCFEDVERLKGSKGVLRRIQCRRIRM